VLPADAELDKSIFDRMTKGVDEFDHADEHAIFEIYRPKSVIAFLARKSEAELQEYVTNIGVQLPGDVKEKIAKLRDNQFGYFEITISTRRFFCRPAGSSEPFGLRFGATGFFAPNPSVLNVIELRPWASNHRFTESARRSERV
jgi:hypothetical protein